MLPRELAHSFHLEAVGHAVGQILLLQVIAGHAEARAVVAKEQLPGRNDPTTEHSPAGTMTCMTETADALLEQALSLDPSERARLASGLLTSLEDDPVDSEEIERLWDEESRRRVELLEVGNARTFSRDEVHTNLDELRATRAR